MILFLCYVFPPLAVLFMGRPFSAVLNLFMTSFGWVPGVRHALVCYADKRGTKAVKQLTNAINHPEWAQAPKPARTRSPKVEPVYVNSPTVGMNGTQFRRKS